MTATTVRDILAGLPVGSTFRLKQRYGERTATGLDFALGEDGPGADRHHFAIPYERDGDFSSWEIEDFHLLTLGDGTDTFEAYTPAMLPMFARLAAAANDRGYCSEYDGLARLVGAPSRIEIAELTRPPQRTWVVRVPMLTHIELEVEASSEDDAIVKSNAYHYRDEFRQQAEAGNLEPVEWAHMDRREVTWMRSITASVKD